MFSKKKSINGEIATLEDLINFWTFNTVSFVETLESEATKAGFDIFGNPLTDLGVFGVPREFLLKMVLNPFHNKNMMEANIKYPLQIKSALETLANLSPLWVKSVTDTYRAMKSKAPDDHEFIQLIQEVTLVSFPVLGVLVEILVQNAEIKDFNWAKFKEAESRGLAEMRKIDGIE